MKLVRDKIPEIIEQTGEKAVVHTASPIEFSRALTEKLLEETAEFNAKPSAEELADVLEVVYALMNLHGGKEHVEAMRQKKADERGIFTKRIILHP